MKLRWATKRFVQEKIEVTSTHAGLAYFNDVHRELFSNQSEFISNENSNDEFLKYEGIKLFESALSKARNGHRLWAMFRTIEWYVWCAENYPETGFCSEYAMELSSISVPGNPKGEAVRSLDPEVGPLSSSLEMPLIIKALKEDSSKKFEHLQERAAVALSVAFGRNPANLTYLREHDLENLTPNDEKPTWVIRVPRIKKRLLNPREDLMNEFLDSFLANIVNDLIEANKNVPTEVEIDGKYYQIDKPIFINKNGNKAAILSGLYDSAFNMTSERISRLLQNFVNRHDIISPLTGEQLKVSARRFRYTVGTELADQGVSKKELARILDHSDTQHVLVYFELASAIVKHLDKASAKGFSQMLNFFRGNIVNSPDEAVNGEREDKHLFFIDESLQSKAVDIGVCGKDKICHLDPPYTCYLCEKFQPYRDANHEHVLDCLLNGRSERLEKYENSRLGIQLDDVIYAVAQVVVMCGKEKVDD